MRTAPQEFLIKLLIGDGDFSFVIITIAFRLNLGLNRLFRYIMLFTCVFVALGDRLEIWLFNIAKFNTFT